jgi:hypothetical protein
MAKSMNLSKPEFAGAAVHSNFLGKQFLEILGLAIATKAAGFEQLGQRYDFSEFLPSKIIYQREFSESHTFFRLKLALDPSISACLP